MPWEANETAAATGRSRSTADEESQPLVVEERGGCQRPRRGVVQLRQGVAVDGDALPVGEVGGGPHRAAFDLRRRGCQRVGRPGWPDEQRRMARQPPAVTAQVGRGPRAPQVGLTAAATEEPLDPGQHRVPIGRRREQDRAVEVAARSTEIGHRHVIAVQRPAAAGERERGIERGVVEQVATQQRVADGDVALPSGREPLSDGHATTVTVAIAAGSHALIARRIARCLVALCRALPCAGQRRARRRPRPGLPGRQPQPAHGARGAARVVAARW